MFAKVAAISIAPLSAVIGSPEMSLKLESFPAAVFRAPAIAPRLSGVSSFYRVSRLTNPAFARSTIFLARLENPSAFAANSALMLSNLVFMSSMAFLGATVVTKANTRGYRPKGYCHIWAI